MFLYQLFFYIKWGFLTESACQFRFMRIKAQASRLKQLVLFELFQILKL